MWHFTINDSTSYSNIFVIITFHKELKLWVKIHVVIVYIHLYDVIVLFENKINYKSTFIIINYGMYKVIIYTLYTLYTL